MRHLIVFAVGSLAVILLFLYGIPDSQQTVVNFFTVYGTFASLFGLIIAYIQIVKVKEATDQTNVAVSENSLRINKILSVSDLSKSVKTIQEIQNYLNTKKYELALLRLKDLRSALNAVQHSQNIIDSQKDETYVQHLTSLGVDIVNLSDHINGYKVGLNFSRMNENLEGLETFITDFENEIKYKKP